MARRNTLKSVFWFVLLAAVLNPSSIEAQTPPARSAQTTKKDYAATRPTRFNITSNGGTGLVQAVSPYSLPAGEVAVGASVMNFDRDPGDIDLFEFGFQGAVGVGKRTELFIRTIPWFRANSSNLDPLRYPAPPLDLFLDTYPTPAVRSGPQFLFTPTLPYKTYSPTNLTETGAFSASRGNNVFGAKVNLRSEDRGDAVGLGVRGFIEIPVETPLYNRTYPAFRNVVGFPSKINYGGDLLVARTWKASELVANFGYRQTGNPERGLRVQTVDSSQTTSDKFLVGAPENIPLLLSNELRFSAGWSVPMFHFYRSYWWLMTEFNHTHFVGSHTPTERLVHPAEVSIGIQTNVPWYHAISMGAEWQLLLNNAGQGKARPSPFQTPDGRGDINFGELMDNPQLTAAVGSFLQSRGAGFSEASNKVFSTNNPAFDVWRNVPVIPGTVESKGHTNILVFITWRIGGKY